MCVHGAKLSSGRAHSFAPQKAPVNKKHRFVAPDPRRRTHRRNFER